MSTTKINYFGATDVGIVRDHNEDNFTLIDLTDVNGNDFGLVFMVADGMGGANAGEVASEIACKVVEDRYLKLKQVPATPRDVEKYLKNLILEAHYQILEHTKLHPECEGMGTTAVIAWIIGDYLHIAWCGDSRAYVYQEAKQEALTPFTDDHSLVWEMVKSGELSAEEARVHPQSNIILQVLGSTDSRPAPSYLSRQLATEERILLCSDGLNGMLPDARIQQLLMARNGTEDTVAVLIEKAREAGGTDNITAILADVEAVGSSSHSQKKGGLLKKKWPFILGLVLLLLVLIIVMLPRAKKDTSVSPDVPEQRAEEASISEQAEKTAKLDAAASPAGQPRAKDKVKQTAQKSGGASERFDYHAELLRLHASFEDKVLAGKKMLDGCESCDHNADLESFNVVIAATEGYIKEQLNQAGEDTGSKVVSGSELLKISESLDVRFDQQQASGGNSLEEQQYTLAVLEKIIQKISEEMDKFTTNVEEKN